MAEYIERERFINHLEMCIDNVRNTNGVTEDFEICLRALKNQPIADVEEVKHGKWLTRYIHNRLSSGAKVRWGVKSCSICTHTQLCVSDYCPNCGAKMDKECEQE